jgi:hypothetical protein
MLFCLVCFERARATTTRRGRDDTARARAPPFLIVVVVVVVVVAQGTSLRGAPRRPKNSEVALYTNGNREFCFRP